MPFTEIGRTRGEANLEEMGTCVWSPVERSDFGIVSLSWHLNLLEKMQIVLQLKCYKENLKDRGKERISELKKEESEVTMLLL